MSTARNKFYSLLEGGFEGAIASKVCSGFIILLIVLNVAAVIVESHAPIGDKYAQQFFLFNVVSVVIFTVEYVARVWVSVEAKTNTSKSNVKARLQYIFSPVALIDFIAIAPFYLSFFFAIDLRYLRMLRMLRLLKLTHYFTGLRLFADVLRSEISSIGAAIFIMLVLVLLSASLMYSIENSAQPEAFQSIPSAIWWSVVTMTTVGYGDVTPVTALGKFIAMFIMLLGVGVVALPAAMLAAKFGDELRSRKRQLERQVEDALEDGILTPQESKSLAALAEKLDLPEDTLNQLIKSNRLCSISVSHCPHCGKALKEDKSI